MPDDRLPVPLPNAAEAAQATEALLRGYEAIAKTSHEMLAAARLGSWDGVAAGELRLRAQIAAVRQVSAQATLAASEQRRRIGLLRDILAVDAEIRARAEPWLARLEQLLAARPDDGPAR